jgi:hypothetical protein
MNDDVADVLLSPSHALVDCFPLLIGNVYFEV